LGGYTKNIGEFNKWQSGVMDVRLDKSLSSEVQFPTTENEKKKCRPDGRWGIYDIKQLAERRSRRSFPGTRKCSRRSDIIFTPGRLYQTV
jgi:hypothetical protein